MPRVTELLITGYRSINEEIRISFPPGIPVVLVGENNAGKSNIVRALDLVIGESYPGSHEPEDHELHGRSKNGEIDIQASVNGVVHRDRHGESSVDHFHWKWPPDNQEKRCFWMVMAGGQRNIYVANETRGQCVCIYIGADRRLSYQLSYVSKFTFLSKLMSRFHDALMADPHRAEELEHQFTRIKELFSEVEQFREFEDKLREHVRELSVSMDYALEVDFSAYDPSRFFHSLRVQAKEGGEVRTLEELGSGQEQLLALAFIQAYAEAFHGAAGLVLIIDEPEANLHPLAQQWLAKSLGRLATAGCQVVLTTHSPAFINIEWLPGLVLVKKEDGATTVVQQTAAELANYCVEHGALAGKATEKSILPFYAAAATQTILSGFFARAVVLVEGESEALALPVYFANLGLDTEKAGIAIIPVGGATSLARWWRLFTAYGVPTYVIVDNDIRDPGDTRERQLNGQRDVLRTLDVPDEEVEGLLQSPAMLVTDRFAVFAGDFERCLRKLADPSYSKFEAEGRVEFGLAGANVKPLLARYVAGRIALAEFPEMKQRLTSLRDSIASLLKTGHGEASDQEPEVAEGAV